MSSGTLNGIKIIEFAGLGPAPFCAMMLADHGAEVIRIDRPGAKTAQSLDPTLRSRRIIELNLKNPNAKTAVFKLLETADGLIEGFRPGVMERLGFGPDEVLKQSPNMVYGRMTGWGQTGPYSQAAGHDINYIALSGALHQCGRRGEKPTPPVNFLGDFGGGGLLLAFGMLAGLLSVKAGGQGQVIDCAMTDGSALLSAMTWGLRAMGHWQDKAGVNLLDTGSHFYDVYETSDGKFVSIGSVEPQFYARVKDKLGLSADSDFDEQLDPKKWSEQKAKMSAVFKTRTRDEWDETFSDADACYAPVLNMEDAPNHPHNRARETFIERYGVIQPSPAPRFSGAETTDPDASVVDTDNILSELGFNANQIADILEKT